MSNSANLDIPPIIHIDETHSTNSYLAELCNKQRPVELTTVSTEYQTAGRGQRGNSWESEKGQNLLFSLVLYPHFIQIKQQFIISQLVSLAIVESLNSYNGGFCIKWPNDIYWKEKKIAGILIENDIIGNMLGRCIIGIGLNINQTDFRSDAPNPISLREIIHKKVDKAVILSDILKRISTYLQQLKKGEKEDIKKKYTQYLFRNKGLHQFKDNSGSFNASIKHIEDNVQLILEDETGQERMYFFKEVSFII